MKKRTPREALAYMEGTAAGLLVDQTYEKRAAIARSIRDFSVPMIRADAERIEGVARRGLCAKPADEPT